MRLQYLTVCIFLILLNVNNCLAQKKPGGYKPKVPKKPISSVSKTISPAKPGQLFYKGGQHPVQLNQTEYEVYKANYSMFPDVLFYPRLAADKDVKEFLAACMNTTLEANINSDRLSKIRNSGEVYMRVVTHVIEFLCLEIYYREPNKAHLLAGGLWEVLMGTVISFVLKRLG